MTERVNDGFAILSQTLPILNSGNVDFFGNGTTAPTLAALEAAEFHGKTLETQTSLMSIGGKASSDLATLPGGPLSLAFGAELRRENYELDPASAMVAGDLSGYGGNFVPVDRSRNVQAVFTEVACAAAAFAGDQRRGALRPLRRRRHFDYAEDRHPLHAGSRNAAASFGRHGLPRAKLARPVCAGDYRCFAAGAERSGFAARPRAPAWIASRSSRSPTAATRALQPEKSRNLTARIVLEPTNNVSIALDYFWIS